MMRTFFFLLAFNFLFRLPELLQFGFLNEDAALFRGSIETIDRDGLFSVFFGTPHQQMLRPFQLIGFWLQGSFFGPNPFPSHLWSLFVFTVSQTILFLALRRQAGSFGSLAAVLLIGVGRAGAESHYWLSDQHDQYLLLFSALSLLLTESWLKNGKVHSLVLLFFTVWGAFLSNEKSVALPFLLLLWAAATARAELKRRGAAFIAVTLLGALGTYLTYRFLQLGTIIGGYDNRVLPDAEISLEFVGEKLLSLLAVPVLQASPALSYTALGAFVGSLAVLFVLLPKKHWHLWLFGAAALLLSSIPTFRYLGDFPHLGVFSTRMFWLPLVTASVLFGVLSGAVWRATEGKKRMAAAAAVLLVAAFSAIGGKRAQEQVAAANNFTEAVYSLYQEHCACSTPTRPKASGLPVHYRSVNVFTEKSWLEHYAVFNGMPECTREEEICSLSFHAGPPERLGVTVRQVSESLLPEILFGGWEVRHASERFHVTTNEGESEEQKRLKLIGRYGEGVEPIEGEVVILFEKGEPRLFTPVREAGDYQFRFSLSGRDSGSVTLLSAWRSQNRP